MNNFFISIIKKKKSSTNSKKVLKMSLTFESTKKYPFAPESDKFILITELLASKRKEACTV